MCFNVCSAARSSRRSSSTTRMDGASRCVITVSCATVSSILAAPGGQAYYYNSQTQQSTYVRPVPSFQAMSVAQVKHVEKKEKPLLKKHISGTEWLCVNTNLGNVFYFNKSKKESLWEVPDEIKVAVAAMKRQEEEDEQRAQQETLKKATQVEEAKRAEIDRIKQEMKGVIKRKADQETPLDELVIAKKARVEEEDGEDSEEDEEEEWQREAAIQLAAEAEEERKRQEQEKKRKEAEQQQQQELEAEAQRAEAARLINMPTKVDLSIEEAKALFKVGICVTISVISLNYS